MTPERWQRVEALFGRGLELTAPSRAELLDQECGDDAELRAVVAAMLAADDAGRDEIKGMIGACVAQVAERVAEPWNGRLIGAYRIERQIGAGGMGTVFLARRADAEYERSVAIKVLANMFASHEERRRFLSERQILANLTHPNIAQLLDGGTTDDGAPYLVMEYIEGVPIDEYCATAHLPLKQRLRLFLHVCAAVQYAHQNLVIHRDIKPGNILVTSADGTPKLLDFGIAKPIDASTLSRMAAMTMVGSRVMTPRHASPEQLRGLAVTTSSDVYSLGVLLYNLLTDRYPYEVPDESARELERAILETQPLRPSAAVSAAPQPGARDQRRRWRRLLTGDLDNIVLKALRKEPERRYATVREFSYDIERYLAHRPVTARADSAGYRLRKFVQRHAAGVATGIAVTVAIAALVIFYTLRLAEERDVQARARAAAERVSQFMVDIFQVADPESGQTDVTARKLLDEAYGEIDRGLQDQPLVAAELMSAMGRAYGGLAMFDRSVELQREALALRRSHLAVDDLEVAEALHHLGAAEANRADYTSARKNLEEALAIRERRLGPQALPVGETLARLAFIDQRESKYPAMLAALQRSLAIHVAEAGPDDQRTASVYALLGAYHWLVGEHPQAREAINRALAIEERASPRNNVHIAGLVHTLGLVAWQMGEYPQAIDLYRRELSIRETHLGPDHPSVALTLYGLGTSSGNAGNFRDAFEYFRRAAAVQEKVFGPDSHYLAMTLGGYGFALLRTGDFSAARPPLTRSLQIFETRFGPQHPDLRAPLAGLSKVAVAERRFDEAHRHLTRALAIVEAKFAPDHPDVLRTRVSLGDVFRAEGNYARALEYYEPSLRAFERTLGLGHPYAADALCGTAEAFRHTGRLSDADEYYARARTNLAAQKLGERRAGVPECLEGHAAVLRELGKDREAEQPAMHAREIRDYLRVARLAAKS